LTQSIQSVGFPTKLSHNNKNIQRGTMLREKAKKNISAQIFLFSVVLIFLKNIVSAINAPINTPAK